MLRQEKKYLLTAVDFMRMSALVANIMRPDCHNGAQGFYSIRSLYFDTPFDDDYNDKIDGLEQRRKIRLRSYAPNSDFAMLEIKQKEGNKQLKRSIKLGKEDSMALIGCDYSVLKNYSDPLAAELYALMSVKAYRPKEVVEYKRKAFIANENKIRITFDNTIRASEACFDIFSNNIPVRPALDDFSTVLEVKFNGFLPCYIKDLINVSDRLLMSVSKYCLARGLAQ
ncbi:MAG: polyphosphate polymerase domain-containing protein [Clostridiales bacterium]|nr:polyphosphate polymerase domain-containing protein [Clostridiales bacterium]